MFTLNCNRKQREKETEFKSHLKQKLSYTTSAFLDVVAQSNAELKRDRQSCSSIFINFRAAKRREMKGPLLDILAKS